MSNKLLDACLLAFALGVASCARAPADADAGAADAAPVADATLAGAPGDDAAVDVPPATAPGAADALAPKGLHFDAALPVPLGSDVQALREAHAGGLSGDAGEGCHFLFRQPPPGHARGTGFMVEGGRFVRMDVDDPAMTAPGGGRVGMSSAEIAALYPGAVDERPHKYVEGARDLRVAATGNRSVLLFETDAQGRVQAWRLGQPPQVDYVEGCG